MGRRHSARGRDALDNDLAAARRDGGVDAPRPDEIDGVLSFACIADVHRRQRARRSVTGALLACILGSLAYSATAWALARDERVPVQSSLLHRVDGAWSDPDVAAVVNRRAPDDAPQCPRDTELAVFTSADGGACVLPTCVPLHSNATVRTLVALTYTINGAEVCTLHARDVPTQASGAKRSARASTFALGVVLCFAAPTLAATVHHYETEEADAVAASAEAHRRQVRLTRRAHHRVRDRVREHPAWS